MTQDPSVIYMAYGNLLSQTPLHLVLTIVLHEIIHLLQHVAIWPSHMPESFNDHGAEFLELLAAVAGNFT
jgi:hypothetical protein